MIDIANPSVPMIVMFGDRYFGNDIAVDGNYVYIVDEDSGLRIYPVQCPGATPVALSSFDGTMTPDGILVTWSSAIENDHLGFRVHRATGSNGDYVRLSGLIEPPGPYRYLDTEVTLGTTYFYRLEAVDRSGGSEFSGPVEGTAGGAVAGAACFALLQNQPNPFVAKRGATAIGFVLAEPTVTRLRVFDSAGRLVRVLVDEPLSAGPHTVLWEGRNDAGAEAGSGIYWYQLDAGAALESRALVKLR